MLGDSAGVGPELVAKVAASGFLSKYCNPVIIGDARIFERGLKTIGKTVPFFIVQGDEPFSWEDGIPVFDEKNQNPDEIVMGKAQAVCGKADLQMIETGVTLYQQGKIDGFCFAPVSYTHLDVYKRQPYEEEEKIPKRGQSLKESLKEQITVIKLEERERKRLEYLIENLNQDGYLMLSEDQFRKECGCTKEEAIQILKILQRLSPPGVGAKDLKECLIQQIDRAENVPDFTKEVVQTYLKELSKNQLGKIAGELQIPLKLSLIHI